MITFSMAQRMERLWTEGAFEVLAKARALEAQGKEIVHLEIGEPDFDTPANIVEEGIQALRKGETHYSPSAGIMPLRQEIASYLSRTRKIKVSPDEVVVTPGAKPVIAFVLLALIDPGDEVVYPNPAYPAYESVINFAGGKAVPLPLLEEREFCFNVGDLEKAITPRTKLIVLNSPENPTGGVLTEDDLRQIADLAQKHNLLVLSDEIYSRILFEGEFHSIASLQGMKERTILVDGFSKTYAMTGWRLGYAAMPLPLAEKVTKLEINVNSCTATFTQWAGIEALKGPQDSVLRMVGEFKKRRDVIVEGLNRIKGIHCRKPKGAFYVFPNIKEIGKDQDFIADYLLREAGVAALAGTAFGEYGKGYLRFSCANSVENIQRALDRIESALAKLR
ncbi:MAG: pyridoxal phosphate-dependent aminotransferase [Armatimonadetes bacterium]|nr:pyridoxal phosphate-dependent aminotransferase [Armatimonadota bacterium]